MPWSTCTQCRALIPVGMSRCSRHTPEAKATRQARGYGTAHVKLRAKLAPQVATGAVQCQRCGLFILPGQRWHLGHHDTDRTRYTGPEHESCNSSRRPRRKPAP